MKEATEKLKTEIIHWRLIKQCYGIVRSVEKYIKQKSKGWKDKKWKTVRFPVIKTQDLSNSKKLVQ